MNRFPARAGSILVAIAAAIVIVAIAIVPFLNPLWVGFEQGRSDAAAWTGYAPADLRNATGGILSDLVFGPPDFDVAVGGQAVLEPRERGHMADVRRVFSAFALLALASVVVLAVAAAVTRAGPALWRALRAGMAGLAVAVVVVGLVGAFAFDAAFEVFHRLFFASGTYLFDPRTDRLVQLFPDQFWFETSIAVGAVILVLAAAVWWFAGRRLAVHRSPASDELVAVPVGPAEASR